MNYSTACLKSNHPTDPIGLRFHAGVTENETHTHVDSTVIRSASAAARCDKLKTTVNGSADRDFTSFPDLVCENPLIG